jgi:hypothetical protein
VGIDFGPEGTQLVTMTIYTPSNAKVSHSAIIVKALSAGGSISDTVSVDVGIEPEYAVWLNYSSASSTSGSEYMYKFTFRNAGNVDDQYNITVSNLEELGTWGWKAEVRVSSTGTWSSYAVATLSAGSQGNLELRLTPIRANPDGKVAVVLVVQSLRSAETVTVLEFEPSMPNFGIPTGGLTVTGPGVSVMIQEVPTDTLVFIGLLVAVTTILMVLSVQKGVFRRKKR